MSGPVSSEPVHIPENPSPSFLDLGLAPCLLEGVESLGFKAPRPIQSAVIPLALKGQDVIGLAETGSGKTATFMLPIFSQLGHPEAKRGNPRALVLAPTREIALQTQDFSEKLEKFHGLRSAILIGGVKMGPQIEALQTGLDIVVATPGRLLDHVSRGNLHLDRVEMVVLDEADHMLDLGFWPQIERIFKLLPKKRHTLMFSATMPPPIDRLARQFLKDPVRIDLLPTGRIACGITHRLYLIYQEDKTRCLAELLRAEQGSALVFARRRIDAESLSRTLEQDGHPVTRIHSDLSQSERVEALRQFRVGEHRILIATDIAARGIDVPGIAHIFNYDIPETVEDYVHRAGRTARGDAEGIVSTIATWQDKNMIDAIERAIGMRLPRLTIPGIPPYIERTTKPATKRWM